MWAIVTLGTTHGNLRIEVCFSRKLNLALLAGKLVFYMQDMQNLIVDMQNLNLQAGNLALFVWKSMSHHEK